LLKNRGVSSEKIKKIGILVKKMGYEQKNQENRFMKIN
jgi:hypothetical protein